MTNQVEYEIVVGLEIHAQLKTRSKLFCGDSVEFGAEPNTHVSPITLAHPGTLPKMNRKAIEFAIKMGLACNCSIEKENYFARKNYFYPDLPKGYQISQHTTPVCKGGQVKIKVGTEEKQVRLNRIHLEEDAGKSLHDVDDNYTSIDYNRAGTALIEIVSEPDLRNGEEAYAFVSEVRKLVRYLDICDGNMEEGSLRCDANISVRPKGDDKLGTKVEIKNLNSIRHIKKAIEVEAERLISLLEKGEKVKQETRSFDALKEKTFATREKEDADDYRYFAEPDLTPFSLPDEFIDQIRQSIPVLQQERAERYRTEFFLSKYDSELLTEERSISDYFNELLIHTPYPKAAANWIIGPLRSWMNEENKEIGEFPLPPTQLGKLVNLVEEGKLSFSTASAKLFDRLVEDPQSDPEQIAIKNNLLQVTDVSAIDPLVEQVLVQFVDKVKEFKKGKKGLMALFVGEVIKRSKGKADPRITTELLVKKINEL